MSASYLPSPVPSDRDPWPGELPFTAFGQFGEDQLDLRVFDQSEFWVDRLGTPHRLEEMDLSYRRNVISHLCTHRESFHLGAIRRELIQHLGDELLGAPSAYALTTELGVPRTADLDALTWLEATPLMRALRRLTPPEV